MADLYAKIASAEMPLSISRLPIIASCPGLFILTDERFMELARESSQAADTGTAVGLMIQLYHEGLGFHEALARAHELKGVTGPKGHTFQLANMDEAQDMFAGYVNDPRNPPEIVVSGSCELRVKYNQPADETDPTGVPVHLVGHIDQVRHDPMGGPWKLWDVKSGKPGGREMTWDYAWQLAAYSLGCTAHYGRDVLPGGIIRVRDYLKKTGHNVFYETPWTLDLCREWMAAVAFHVAQLRQGIILTHPSRKCGWCPAGGPHLCGRDLEETVRR